MMEDSNGSKNNKILWLIFGFIIAIGVIVGIAVGIIAINGDNGDTEEPQFSDSSSIPQSEVEQEYIRKLESGDKSYQISLKIAEIYNSGEKDRALSMYNEELDESLEQQNYGLYLELLSTRSIMLRSDDRCTDAILYYDTIDYTGLPEEYQIAFYYNALNTSTICDNQQHIDFWDQKIKQSLSEDKSDV